MLLTYKPGGSLFHKVDPLSKTIWCLIISAWMMGLRDPLNAGVLSLFVLLFSWIAARLDLGKYLKVALVFLLGSLMLVVYHGLFRPGVGIHFWAINLSYDGLSVGAAIALRTFGIVASALAFATTTSPKDLTNALVRIGVPYRIAHIVYLSLRLMPLVETDIEAIGDAQKTRKVKPGIGSFTSSIVALIASQYRRIDETAIALETRGFGLSEKRTISNPVTISPLGIVLVIVTLLTMIIHLVWIWF